MPTLDELLEKTAPIPQGTSVSAIQPWEGPMRLPALFGSSLLEGAGRSADLGLKYVLPAISGGFQPLSLVPSLNTGTLVSDFLAKEGLTRRSDLLAASPADRYVRATGEGLGAALPLAPLGPEVLLAGPAGALASEGAKDAVLPPSVAEGVGTVAGLAAGSPLALARSSLNPLAAEFATAGLPIRSPAYVSENPLVQRLTAPWAPRAATEGDLGSAIERTASSLGSARTPDEAGQTLVSSAENWRKNIFPSEIEEARAPLDAAIPASAPWTPGNLLSSIDSLFQHGDVEATSVRRFLNEMEDSKGRMGQVAQEINGWLDRVAASPTSRIRVGPSNLARPNPVPELTWKDGTAFRTGIGKWLSKGDPNTEWAKKFLYGATSEDLRNVAAAHGAEDLFDNYNSVSTAAHEFNDGLVEKILGAQQPGQAAQQLLSSVRVGPGLWDEVAQRLPDAASDLAGMHLRQIGLARPEDPTSIIAPAFAARFGREEAMGTAPSIFPNAEGLDTLRAMRNIQGRLGGPQIPPGDNISLGSKAFGAAQIGGLVARGIAHLLGAGSETGIDSLLIGEAGGAALPYLARFLPKLGANSSLAAQLAARRWNPAGVGLAAGAGATSP